MSIILAGSLALNLYLYLCVKTQEHAHETYLKGLADLLDDMIAKLEKEDSKRV